MKKYILFFMSGILMTSCVDTEVLPYDLTVAEDMWQDADDVQYMVDGAYEATTDEDFIERCIVWGGFRADELNDLVTTLNTTKENDLTDIKEGNMDYTNTYSDWAIFYDVINRCNLVIEKAPDVVSIDPEYTEGTLNVDLSQMIALRSLCYFYLVRAFRDVPITSGAYTKKTDVDMLPQSAPLEVLDMLVEDLTEAMESPLSPTGYSDWRKVGYLNKEGIAALLADVYLWRASMTGSSSDYESCVEYCDIVIDSKDENYDDTRPGSEKAWTNLIYSAEEFYEQIFINGNSDESIFEIQMDGSNNYNYGLRNCYWNYDSSSRSYGLMKASLNFAEDSNGDDDDYFVSTYDERLYESVFDGDEASDQDDLYPFKFASTTATGNRIDGTPSWASYTHRGYTGTSGLGQNWIVYRLSDVMLMKAEALVQLVSSSSTDSTSTSTSDDSYLRQAFALVNEVNKRALLISESEMSSSDTLVYSSYNNKSDMEELVLAERFRELCFEGKRYFDLLRYNYRHVDGIDPSTILAEQGDDAKTGFVENDATMMDYMTRGMTSGSSAASAKMPTEPYLYFPVNEDELEVNTLLQQNPAYKEDETYVKNY